MNDKFVATCETNGHLWGVGHRCIFCKTINLDPIPSSDAEREITSYQIAKDNLELRLARAVLANEKPIVGTFAGHWTY